MYSPLVFVAISVVVASLHMIAPDHWLPLTALSLKRKYGKGRVLEISAVLGILHGSTSVILSLVALFLGLSFFGLNALILLCLFSFPLKMAAVALFPL